MDRLIIATCSVAMKSISSRTCFELWFSKITSKETLIKRIPTHKRITKNRKKFLWRDFENLSKNIVVLP
ncbi:MAG: hypothetical protein J6T61_02865, partial [Spirochaetia bacterium]|nr:hypothetical protein [Spirochaetia bacterium]